MIIVLLKNLKIYFNHVLANQLYVRVLLRLSIVCFFKPVLAANSLTSKPEKDNSAFKFSLKPIIYKICLKAYLTIVILLFVEYNMKDMLLSEIAGARLDRAALGPLGSKTVPSATFGGLV